MKLIISGSRSLHDYTLIDKAIRFHKIEIESIEEVVSGCDPGIDSLAIKWAQDNKIPINKMPAKWNDITTKPCIIKENSYGKYNVLAGMNRNKKMGDYADVLLAIWDCKSKGTEQMIHYMVLLNKEIYVYEI